MNRSAFLKTVLPHVLSILILLGTISIYFGPQFNGKIIAGTDVVSATAWSKQVEDYADKTGRFSHWNPSMFSGMPWGLLTAGYQYNLLRSADKMLRLGVKPPMGIAIKAALLCYISLLLLGTGPMVALFGSMAFAFNVNFMVLLEAGHQSKFSVIANFPLILAGLMLCWRKKWKWGAPAIAFGTSIAIANNHIQMVYYLLLCFVIVGLVYLVFAIKEKSLPTFARMSGIALAAAIIGALSNYSVLQSADDFSEDTMRGKPILVQAATPAAPTSSTEEGLEWNYAMQWSNELKDLGSILLPRIVGGSSYEEVSPSSETGRLLQSNNAPRGSDNTYQAPMYWGGLPSTSGPYYSSIVLISLFILSFFFLPNRIRWSFGLACLFVLLLSMGKHASWLNLPMFDLLPLMNKFRAPSSAVTILPLFMTLMAGLGLSYFITRKKRSKLVRPVLYAGGGVLVMSLLLALLGPSMFPFENAADGRYSVEIRNIFVDTRKELFSADAWRNVGFSFVVLAVLYAYVKRWIKSGLALTGILVALIFVDLLSVNRRHLDRDNWESARQFDGNFNLTDIDEQIFQLEPKGRGYYRVFDIPNMRSSVPSYYHNTIGGYHAAKLQRYQDMLDYHIDKGDHAVLSMLNAKYFITNDRRLQLNDQALGNAWCVQDVRFVNTANEEIEGITGMNTATTAIVHQGDFPQAPSVINPGNANCTIEMTDYAPDHWTYSFNSTSDQFVVFSEVWYNQEKGMTAKIDGQEVDFFRVNYILRGLQVPAGQHTIEFTFEPVIKGAAISVIASLLILAMILYNILESTGSMDKLLGREVKKKKKVKVKKKSS